MDEVIGFREKIAEYDRMIDNVKSTVFDRIEMVESKEHQRELMLKDLQRTFDVRMQMQANITEEVKQLKAQIHQEKLNQIKKEEDMLDKIIRVE